MSFSKEVYQELVACKSSIDTLQKGIEKAQTLYELAKDVEDKKEEMRQERIIEYADNKINKIISTQAKTMGCSFNDIVYLIYNLEDAKRFISY